MRTTVVASRRGKVINVDLRSLFDGETKLYENLDDKVEDTGSANWWIDLLIVAILVLGAGMMSGLTIGLMGLDITTLDILSRSGSHQEKIYSKRILPLLRRHHLLLVTLLLMNAIAMEALPIFLERLVPPIFAVLVSVTLILTFGEYNCSSVFMYTLRPRHWRKS